MVRDQFETNFFGPVNMIKAVLPKMRKRSGGHILVLGGISKSLPQLPSVRRLTIVSAGHLGTPGLGIYCSSGWAMEGFCDVQHTRPTSAIPTNYHQSLAYEVAPFNIKMTIIQANMEVNVLTNKITAAPALPQYNPENNHAPLCRSTIGGILDRLAAFDDPRSKHPSKLPQTATVPLYPKLPASMKSVILAETLNAITAIAGHENPPARHIVGHEAVSSVKEKLKTVSEELEDFAEVSSAVDIESHQPASPEARSNGSQEQ